MFKRVSLSSFLGAAGCQNPQKRIKSMKKRFSSPNNIIRSQQPQHLQQEPPQIPLPPWHQFQALGLVDDGINAQSARQGHAGHARGDVFGVKGEGVKNHLAVP